MSLEDVLARSRQRTKMTERRRFTVAADKAFEKQKQFALQQPADWVLRAFQAAVFSHAELVGMDTRPTQVSIGWLGGVGVLPDELDELFHYLMTDRSDPSTRHLSQLALAVVGALAMKPAEVRIESIGAGQPVAMIIDARGEARVGEPSAGIDGTYMTVVKSRSLFQRFHGVSEAAEIDRLWPLSRFSPVPLLVNPCTAFEYSRFGYTDVSAHVVGAKEGRRWTLWRNGATPDHEPNTLAIVVGGVLIEHVEVPGLGMCGVMCDDDLRLSADQSRVARGPRWARLLHFLAARVRRHLEAEGMGLPAVQLPELREEEDEGVIVVEAPTAPVPDLLPTVPPRPELPCPRGVGPALLYVLPDDLPAMLPDLDPYELPLQIAVLSEPQAETIRRSGRPAHRLTAGTGLAFVRRMAVADEVLATGVVREGESTLTLRLHPGDSAPPWGSPQAPLPMVVRSGGKTLHCEGAGLYLPGCSVVVDGPADPGQDPEGSFPGLSALDLVARRGLEAALGVAGHDAPEARALLLHLVGHLGLPHLVERDGDVVLDVVLPEALRHARSLPLLGDLDLDGLLALAGTDGTVSVDDVDRYAPLEAWLGVGHLTDGSVECGVLAAVGFDGAAWRPVDRLGQSGVSQILAILPTFRPAPVPRGRQRFEGVPLPLFAVFRAERSPWEVGAQALLGHAHRGAKDSERLQALLPLVTVHLARMLGQRGTDLHPANGRRVEAVAVGGLENVGADVLPVSLDLYRALLPDVRLPLHLDDESDVWGRPDRHDWVVRLPVESASVDGWVGLRRPFDPSGGVFLHRGDGHVELLRGYDERFPAHGVLRGRGAIQVDGYGVLLPGLQLYRSLVVWLRAHPDDVDALAYARHLVHTDVASPMVTELAPFVVLEGSGLTLAQWLDLEPTARPALAEADEGFLFVPSAVGSAKWVERLQAALDVGCPVPVRLRGLRGSSVHGSAPRFGARAAYRGRRSEAVDLDVWLDGADTVFEVSREVEILLLDGLRAAAAALGRAGYPVDVASAVEVISAGR